MHDLWLLSLTHGVLSGVGRQPLEAIDMAANVCVGIVVSEHYWKDVNLLDQGRRDFVMRWLATVAKMFAIRWHWIQAQCKPIQWTFASLAVFSQLNSLYVCMYVVFRFYISLMIFISDQCINIDRVIMLYVNLRKLFHYCYFFLFLCWFLLYFLLSSFYHIMMNKDVYITG